MKAEILDALLLAGATAEMIVAAVKAEDALKEEEQIERRRKNADRQKRYRLSRQVTSRNGDMALVAVSNGDQPLSPKKEIPPTPPKEKTPLSLTVDDSARAPEISRSEELELRDAAGAAFNAASPNIFVMREPIRWLLAGMDFRLDILPAVRDLSKRVPEGKIFDWNYFSRPIADWHEARTKPMPKGMARDPPKRESLATKVLKRMQNSDERDNNPTIELTAARVG